ncbi:hypothetical protein LIX17_25030 (plasmid) [Mycobacterium avium subsp. hominissuis]|uniref:hypothetical protein n=1 Tax=Mycobacterium avium TaxID=1764 RepID=UPI003140BCEB
MSFLDATAPALTTGTVVELANGNQFGIDPNAGESYVIEPHGVLAVVTVVSERAGERRCERRYSPAAWISVTKTSEPLPPGSARKQTGVGLIEGIDRLI